MFRYLNDPGATAAIKTHGWQHTGDLGYRDKDGFVYISDRKRDMIITGGFNVFPLEVEQVLLRHPAVQDCAVIGVPDEKWGEAVKAVVELAPGKEVDGGGADRALQGEARQHDGAEERRLHRRLAAGAPSARC